VKGLIWEDDPIEDKKPGGILSINLDIDPLDILKKFEENRRSSSSPCMP